MFWTFFTTFPNRQNASLRAEYPQNDDEFWKKMVKNNSVLRVLPRLSRWEKNPRIWSKTIKFSNLQVTITLKFVICCKKYQILHARQHQNTTESNNSLQNDATRRLHGTNQSIVWLQNSVFCEKFCLKSNSIVSYEGTAAQFDVFSYAQWRILRLNLVQTCIFSVQNHLNCQKP